MYLELANAGGGVSKAGTRRGVEVVTQGYGERVVQLVRRHARLVYLAPTLVGTSMSCLFCKYSGKGTRRELEHFIEIQIDVRNTNFILICRRKRMAPTGSQDGIK